MPASFFVILLLNVLIVILVLLCPIAYGVAHNAQKHRKAKRWMAFLVVSPVVGVAVFFFSVMMLEGLVAGLRGNGSSFSEGSQGPVNAIYGLRGGGGYYELFHRQTDQPILYGVDSLYLEGESLIVSRNEYLPSPQYELYRVDGAGYQPECQLIDTSSVMGELWSRYTQAHNIDSNEVLCSLDVAEKNYNSNLLIGAVIALLLASLTIYYLYRRLIKRI